MDYRTAMELCRKTVDGHAVRAQELADMTGYSLYHFCHVFRAYLGMSDGDAPAGFVKLDVPAARYAVFGVPPVSGDIHGGEALAREVRKTWKHIFKEWMDRSAWRFDERGMCFEFYCGKTTQTFVPVKAKE